VSGLLALAWAGLVFTVAWTRRPRESSGRPELAALQMAPPKGPTVLVRWGAATQGRIPILAELSSVVVGAALATSVVLLLLDPAVAVAVTVFVGVVAGARSVSRQRARAAALIRQTPAAIDLLSLCVSSGSSPRLSVARVAELVTDPLHTELAAVVARTSSGESLAVAIRRLAVRGHPLRPLALGIASAEETGQPLGPLLERQGREARLALRRHAEERARRLPVTMLLPLATCVLPAFCLIVVVPMIANGFSHLL
jgi:pilus assembly protein TadC